MENTITIKDIAKECGVSIATVSRVINGSPKVLPETREKIELAIKKYNYSPNAIAKSLVSRKSSSIGVTIPDISNPYFSRLFCEIEATAHEENYSVFLCNTMFRSSHSSNPEKQREEDYFQMLIEAKVAGAIIAGGHLDVLRQDKSYLDSLLRLANAVPLVILSKKIPGIPAIFLDREENTGMVQAIHFLASLGHEKIAFLGGEKGITITEERLITYRNTLDSLHIPHSEDRVVLTDYYVSDGYTAAKHLIEKKIPFTAALAINDNVAIGALRAFTDCGIAVPNDISLISCEEFGMSAFYTPRLTGIERHSDVFGQLVINTLLACIRQDTLPAFTPIISDLMIRESCSSLPL